MTPLSKHIQPELPPNRSNIFKIWNHTWGPYHRKGMPILLILRRIIGVMTIRSWYVEGIIQITKILINIPSFVYGHSPLVLAKFGMKWGV